MFFELTDKDLKRVKYCSGLVEGYRTFQTCPKGGDQHYHFNLKSLSDSRQKLGPITRTNLLLGLLISANLLRQIEHFPLFRHLDPETCAEFQEE